METFGFHSKITRFPYENSVVSEGNTTISPMERKAESRIPPMEMPTDESVEWSSEGQLGSWAVGI
jgi:hypothetical protein